MDSGEMRVFVSYSRSDAALVTPIVQIMRAVGGSVFQDADSIPPGKRWRLVIEESIDQASIIFLFWCAHSLGSDQVRLEWQRAVAEEKVLIPTLLDDTPLPPPLEEYQAIDLRNLAAMTHARKINLLPGEAELWRRRHIDSLHGNHLLSIEAQLARQASLELLWFANQHFQSKG